MPYSSDVILYAPFDSQPIAELKSSLFFEINGDTPELEDGVFGSSWKMSDTTYIESSSTLLASTGLTIGFWLKPVNPGIVTGYSLEPLPLKMPLMGKASFVIGDDSVSSSTWTFIIWEETQTDGLNIMKVSIRGTLEYSMTSCTLTSSPYEVGSFKHFWLVYNGTSQSLRLYIDAVEDYEATISGTVPTQLSLNSSPFSINNSLIGDNFQIARNSGNIDDLVIFNQSKNDESIIRRAANEGVNYVAQTDLVDLVDIDQGAIFDDIGTTKITSIYSLGDKIYVAKNNGKLLKGEKTLWQSRKVFIRDAEDNISNTAKKTTIGQVTKVNNAIKIVDSIVRI